MVTAVNQLPAAAAQVPDGAEQERLLDLFWNRAELKKEFSRLRQDRDQLKERLRKQEGDILRLKQQLEQLEGLLADPRQAANTALFFQLRGLWSHCRRRLVRMAGDLRDQQQALEAELGIRAADAKRRAAVAALDEQRSIARKRLAALQADLASLNQGRQPVWMSGLTGGKERRVQQEAAMAACASAKAQLNRLDRERAAKANEILPEPGPLSVAGRRKVNLAVIALAQELLLHFAADGLAALARDSVARQLSDVSYGDSSECRRLSKLAAERLQQLEAMDDLPARTRCRARYLRNASRYRLETDAVPEASVCSLMPRAVDDQGRAVGNDVESINVLSEEYWDLYAVLVN